MAVQRLKTNRSTERRKVDLAVKYREQSKETGGKRLSAKKVRHKLEARNIPIGKTARRPEAGKKQKPGRKRTPARTAASRGR